MKKLDVETASKINVDINKTYYIDNKPLSFYEMFEGLSNEKISSLKVCTALNIKRWKYLYIIDLMGIPELTLNSWETKRKRLVN